MSKSKNSVTKTANWLDESPHSHTFFGTFPSWIPEKWIPILIRTERNLIVIFGTATLRKKINFPKGSSLVFFSILKSVLSPKGPLCVTLKEKRRPTCVSCTIIGKYMFILFYTEAKPCFANTFEESQISNIIRRTKGKRTLLQFHQFYSAKKYPKGYA